MKITFEEIIDNHQQERDPNNVHYWLCREILTSATSEIIKRGQESRSYDVKLLVNGIEIEPKLFSELMNKLEEYIDKEARSIVESRIGEVSERVRQKQEVLERIIERATTAIENEFYLKPEEE